jgi:hypothetical protein
VREEVDEENGTTANAWAEESVSSLSLKASDFLSFVVKISVLKECIAKRLR